MTTTARTLVVVRHAKAETSAATDFERRLTPSGQRDAVAAGEWLADQAFRPDVALVSAAERTRETWAGIATGARWDGVDPVYDRGLYAAEPDTVIDLVRGVAGDPSCVLVLGHNPTMSSLAMMLDDGRGDADAGAELATGFPTCAFAVLRVHSAWSELGAGTAASVEEVHVARGRAPRR